jgi:DNA-binding NtrC family response regulator
MQTKDKKILIMDENGFSRICSAILESKGYGTEVVSHGGDLAKKLNSREVKLLVTSYPYCSAYFDDIKKRNIPTIILSDNMDAKLMHVLNDPGNFHCMIKPLDYDRFKALVGQVINEEVFTLGGVID